MIAADKLARFAAKSSAPLSSTSAAVSLDINSANQSVAGLADGSAVVVDHATSKVIDTLKGHSKAITQARFHPTDAAIFTASSDATANVWTRRADGKYAVASTVKEHRASVTDISVSPAGDFLLTASADRSWSLYDVAAGVSRYQVIFIIGNHDYSECWLILLMPVLVV